MKNLVRSALLSATLLLASTASAAGPSEAPFARLSEEILRTFVEVAISTGTRCGGFEAVAAAMAPGDMGAQEKGREALELGGFLPRWKACQSLASAQRLGDPAASAAEIERSARSLARLYGLDDARTAALVQAYRAKRLATAKPPRTASWERGGAEHLLSNTHNTVRLDDGKGPWSVIPARENVRPAELKLSEAAIGQWLDMKKEWWHKVRDAAGNLAYGGSSVQWGPEMLDEVRKVCERYQAELREGLADLMRSRHWKESSWRLGCGAGEDWSSGYRCGGAFLGFVARARGEGVITKTNAGLRRGGFTDREFETLVGATLHALWAQCLAFECAGGKRPRLAY